MSKGSLARSLSRLERFADPKLELEQYATPGEVAAELVWTATMAGDIDGKRVVDLGAGTGVLGIGALECGARHVTFVEVDPDAIAVLERNLEPYDPAAFLIVTIDATDFDGSFDTCIMNPPFGAQRRHADTAFLDSALRLCDRAYSIHNANARTYLERYAQEHGLRFSALALRAFRIPASFAHHRKPRVDQEVILCAFARPR